MDGLVIHHSSKLYWRERINVDFTFIYFEKFNIIEVVYYNSDTGVEAVRTYVDADKCFLRLDASDIESKVLAKQEELVRKRQPRLPADELTTSVRNSCVGIENIGDINIRDITISNHALSFRSVFNHEINDYAGD